MRGSWTFAILLAAALVAAATADCRREPGNDIPDECPMIDPHDMYVKLAHEWDCRKYYRCDGGERRLEQCPQMKGIDMHFNPPLQDCDYQKCVDCKDMYPMPDLSDCSKYLLINQTALIGKDCPRGLHFSPVNMTCMPPSESGCKQPGLCDDKPNGTVLADETDCSKYFVCINETQVSQDCLDGLYYNNDLGTCVKPYIATCHVPIPVPDMGNCSRYIEISYKGTVTKQCPHEMYFSPVNKTCMPPSESGCQQPGLCYDKPNGTALANETDCSKYSVCINETQVFHDCLDGLYYNNDLGTCVDPDIATCRMPILVPDMENCSIYREIVNFTTTTKKCPGELYFSRSKKTCVTPLESGCQLRGECLGKRNGTVLTNEINCSKYFMCINGIKVPHDCPDGIYFNNALGTCGHPKLATCSSPILVPNQRNCSIYTEYNDKKVVTKQCPSGLYFSPTNKTCVSPPESGCNPRGPCDGVPEARRIPHEDTCSEYSLCREGKIFFEYTCHSDQHFREATDSCEPPLIANCKYTTLIPHEWNCSKYYMIMDNTKILESCYPGMHFSPTNKTCMPPLESGCEPRGPCDGFANGTLVTDETNCGKYFLCLNGVPVAKDCPEGLEFGMTHQSCVEEAIAGCTHIELDSEIWDHSKYWRKTNGHLIMDVCPNGTLYDEFDKICSTSAKIRRLNCGKKN